MASQVATVPHQDNFGRYISFVLNLAAIFVLAAVFATHFFDEGDRIELTEYFAIQKLNYELSRDELPSDRSVMVENLLQDWPRAVPAVAEPREIRDFSEDVGYFVDRQNQFQLDKEMMAGSRSPDDAISGLMHTQSAQESADAKLIAQRDLSYRTTSRKSSIEKLASIQSRLESEVAEASREDIEIEYRFSLETWLADNLFYNKVLYRFYLWLACSAVFVLLVLFYLKTATTDAAGVFEPVLAVIDLGIYFAFFALCVHPDDLAIDPLYHFNHSGWWDAVKDAFISPFLVLAIPIFIAVYNWIGAREEADSSTFNAMIYATALFFFFLILGLIQIHANNIGPAEAASGYQGLAIDVTENLLTIGLAVGFLFAVRWFILRALRAKWFQRWYNEHKPRLSQ